MLFGRVYDPFEHSSIEMLPQSFTAVWQFAKLRNLIAFRDTNYPEHAITVTSRDPEYMIKAKLRRKNRLMRAGRVEEAGALARQVERDITHCSK